MWHRSVLATSAALVLLSSCPSNARRIRSSANLAQSHKTRAEIETGLGAHATLRRCFDQGRSPHSDEGFLPDFPIAVESFDFDSVLDGASGAQLVRFKSGLFIKKTQKPEHSRSEFAAIKFFGTYFSSSGEGHVPTCCLYEGDSTVLACRWIHGLETFSSDVEARELLMPLFVVSALAGHYDVGVSGNSMVLKSQLYFIDLGDCFGFTASGKTKGEHRCEKSEDYTCLGEDRTCFCATWGDQPYQLFDFRSPLDEGGYYELDTYWEELTGSLIKQQFVANAHALENAVDTCCLHEDDREIREVLVARFKNMQRFFQDARAVEVLDLDLRSYTEANYWNACKVMQVTAVGRP